MGHAGPVQRRHLPPDGVQKIIVEPLCGELVERSAGDLFHGERHGRSVGDRRERGDLRAADSGPVGHEEQQRLVLDAVADRR